MLKERVWTLLLTYSSYPPLLVKLKHVRVNYPSQISCQRPTFPDSHEFYNKLAHCPPRCATIKKKCFIALSATTWKSKCPSLVLQYLSLHIMWHNLSIHAANRDVVSIYPTILSTVMLLVLIELLWEPGQIPTDGQTDTSLCRAAIISPSGSQHCTRAAMELQIVSAVLVGGPPEQHWRTHCARQRLVQISSARLDLGLLPCFLTVPQTSACNPRASRVKNKPAMCVSWSPWWRLLPGGSKHWARLSPLPPTLLLFLLLLIPITALDAFCWRCANMLKLMKVQVPTRMPGCSEVWRWPLLTSLLMFSSLDYSGA